MKQENPEIWYSQKKNSRANYNRVHLEEEKNGDMNQG